LALGTKTPDYDDDWNTNGHQMRAVELLTSWVKAQNVAGLTLEVPLRPALEGRRCFAFTLRSGARV
jgi:hypothetical protein